MEQEHSGANDKMNRCDWADCIDAGLFEGVNASLINAEGRKNISLDKNRVRFIYLCPMHFDLGVGNHHAEPSAPHRPAKP